MVILNKDDYLGVMAIKVMALFGVMRFVSFHIWIYKEIENMQIFISLGTALNIINQIYNITMTIFLS